MRRLRSQAGLRRLVRETRLSADCLIYPLFVTHGRGIREPIPSLPGQYRYSADTLLEEAAELVALGLGAVLLFGIPEHKDALGTQAWAEDGVVQQAVRALKERYPELVVITDVCLCEYTSHGHCGLVDGREVLNDPTLELLGRVAVSHAEAGADVVAPSDMMDGRVQAIRAKLDAYHFNHVPILSYAAKYASAFYGPFREAAGSAPQFGDRSGYQMDPANSREALREIELDLEEGADLVMVKPALAYLDVLRLARDRFACPLGAYNVSGEYAMIKAAAARGWLDERRTAMEVLTAIRRAGADFIVTYFAKDAARWLAEA